MGDDIEADRDYVSRFAREFGRLPEYCTRCEQWEGVCWHQPTPRKAEGT